MSASTDPQDRSAAEIERDVERSRARVTHTIDELRARMSPGQLMDQAMDYARSSGGAEFFRNLGSSVRDNPLPVLLIGAGIGWMMLSRGTERTAQAPLRRLPAPDDAEDYAPEYDETGFGDRGQFGEPGQRSEEAPGLGERIGRGAAATRDAAARVTGAATGAASAAAARTGAAASDIAERATAAAGSVADTGADLARRAASAGSRAAHQARMRYHDMRDAASGAAESARSGWATMVEERPLLLGVLGLAAGAALGAMLPRTEAEDRLMGEASDAALRGVEQVAGESYDELRDAVVGQAAKVQEAVVGAYEDAKDRLNRDGIAAAGAVAADAAGQVASAAGDAVQAVSEKAKSTLSDAAGTDDAEERKAGPDRGAAPR